MGFKPLASDAPGAAQRPTQAPAKVFLPDPDPPKVEKGIDRVLSWLDKQLSSDKPAKFKAPPIAVDDFESNPKLTKQDQNEDPLRAVRYARAPPGKPFVNGASYDDVIQGGVGSCHFISSLSSVASVSAKTIENGIRDLGNGRYLVTLYVDSEKGQRFSSTRPRAPFLPQFSEAELPAGQRLLPGSGFDCAPALRKGSS